MKEVICYLAPVFTCFAANMLGRMLSQRMLMKKIHEGLRLDSMVRWDIFGAPRCKSTQDIVADWRIKYPQVAANDDEIILWHVRAYHAKIDSY